MPYATLKFHAKKKHTVRYDYDDRGDGAIAVVKSIYINKMLMEEPYPKEVKVTVEW